MNPTTPFDPGSANSHGGTIMRPSAVTWGHQGAPENPQPGTDPGSLATPGAIEHALAAAAEDPARVTDLLDELSRGRLWLPLPDDDRPVTDGSAVTLPTVTYRGAEFVPAFTSARELAAWNQSASSLGRGSVPASRLPEEDAQLRPGDRASAATPHIVVPAADLARLLPAGMGIALNPGTKASIPVYPDDVRYLAAERIPLADGDGAQIGVGRPPADPVALLTEMRAMLGSIPDVREASRTWLSVPGQGEGLVISVTLHDPASEKVQLDVITAIERAVDAVPGPGFPIDVTFPGEGEPDEVDEWIAAHAEPFYIRPLYVEAERPELLAPVLGDVLRAPRRHPHPVDPEVRDHPVERFGGLVLDDVGQRARRAGQRHVDGGDPVRADLDAVDQPEVHHVDAEFRVDHVTQRLEHVLLLGGEAGGHLLGLRRRLLRGRVLRHRLTSLPWLARSHPSTPSRPAART
jgi:SseB protein N-terminal domain/SseB protein C-terminal domain